MSDIRDFGRMPDGTPVQLVDLRNANGLKIGIITLGAILRELWVPDRLDCLGNVVLGADSLNDYLGGFPAPAAVIGRVANRIANARFHLGGHEYHLPANDGRHHLHGGPGGFGKRVWQIRSQEDRHDESFLELSLISPDGDQGYPGTIAACVCYSLTSKNELRITYKAETDQLTPINLTSHAYFNLSKGPDILDHLLWLDADHYTPSDFSLVPLGTIQGVRGTVLDFMTPRRIGERIRALQPSPGGYDHNLILREGRDPNAPAAWLMDPETGRRMTVYTSEPAIQFYSGNFLSDFVALGRRAYQRHGGACLECQHYPDSVNQPSFPSILITPGHPFRSTTTLHFEVVS